MASRRQVVPILHRAFAHRLFHAFNVGLVMRWSDQTTGPCTEQIADIDACSGDRGATTFADNFYLAARNQLFSTTLILNDFFDARFAQM